MNTTVIINFHLILAALWRRRYLIAMPVLVFPIVAILISIVTPRNWQTHTTILVQESAKMNPFLEDLSVSTDLENRITALDTLLHSRHMLIQVGEDLGELSADSSSLEQEQYVKEISSALSVQLVGKDLVKLIYRANSPEAIDSTLLAIRKRFLEKLLAPEISAIAASEVFLTEQLTIKQTELRGAELSLAQFKQTHADSLPRLYGANSQRLAQISQLIEQRKIELSGALAAKKTIRTRLAQVDPVMSEIEQSIVATKGELAILRSRYTDKHSKVQTALRKLVQLEEERVIQSKTSYKLDAQSLQRLWEIANQMKDGDLDNQQSPLLVSQLKELQLADGKVEQIREELASIESQAEILKNTLASSGDMERRLQELERDLTVKRALYEDLLARYEKAKITGALGKFEQPERIKIIDEPYQPSIPNNFPLLVFLLAGIIGGLSLGIGLALFAEVTDTTVRAKKQLEMLTRVPVITRIPRILEQQFIGEK
ncbi:chain-length determining protein [Thalassotalea sp. M1531]|uniref:Chain-length determining protein n=1 Tax=Thalassotalea algicola TaxID=2716224 RepID=A0A7Y0LDB0_9GAMM|nr:Wzz/FepE/Etk N-terminal domain-containing protein [Thalassotalea algicola]NMP32093.1 chain-length determining protein [Thalassotalea algicola]